MEEPPTWLHGPWSATAWHASECTFQTSQLAFKMQLLSCPIRTGHSPLNGMIWGPSCSSQELAFLDQAKCPSRLAICFQQRVVRREFSHPGWSNNGRFLTAPSIWLSKGYGFSIWSLGFSALLLARIAKWSTWLRIQWKNSGQWNVKSPHSVEDQGFKSIPLPLI